MPSAMQYKPDDNAVRQAADAELKKRRDMAATNWQYYFKGTVGNFVDERDNVKDRLPRQTVDRLVSYLAPTFPRIELNLDGATSSEEFVNGVLDASDKETLLTGLITNGCISGQCYARVAQMSDGIRVLNLNPANIITFWDRDNFQDVLWHELHWSWDETRYRQDVIQGVDEWVIIEYKNIGGAWDVINETVWAYPLSPIVTWQHYPIPNVFYGDHEFGHADIADQVARNKSILNRTIRFFGYPRTVGTGFSAGEVEKTAIGDLWTIPNENARIQNLEMNSDLTAVVDLIALLRSDYLSTSRMVMVPSDADFFRNVTNLAIETLFMDTEAKNRILQRRYTYGLQEIVRRVLMLGGFLDTRAKIFWPSALPKSLSELTVAVKTAIELGVLSLETASNILELVREDELKRMKKENGKSAEL